MKVLEALYGEHSSNEEIAVQYAKGLFNLTVEQDLEIAFNVTLLEKDEDRGTTIGELQAYLHGHPGIRSDFQRELDVYLRKHPEHRGRYHCLNI